MRRKHRDLQLEVGYNGQKHKGLWYGACGQIVGRLNKCDDNSSMMKAWDGGANWCLGRLSNPHGRHLCPYFLYIMRGFASIILCI